MYLVFVHLQSVSFVSLIRLDYSRHNNRSQITLVNNEEIISDDSQVAETMNFFFEKAVKSLNITENRYHLSSTSNSNDGPIETAIKKFNCHPSIIAINRNFTIASYFNFVKVNPSNIDEEISKLNTNKAGIKSDIPSKLLKDTSDISSQHLNNIWNREIIENKVFSRNVKKADICPMFKTDDRTLAKNYRPVSLLPNVPKVFERILQTQLLSPVLCGYRKGYNTQRALITLREKMKESLDNIGLAAAVLMDLTKAFDTIHHELLIAKLHAYGFNMDALEIICSYLKNRLQRTNINVTFSSWTELLERVPQGSILVPILFNIYLNDLFFILKECNVCNYADDTTPYVCDNDTKNLFLRLEHDSALVIEWFQYNYMKLNAEKCHLIVSGHKHEHTWVKLENEMIWEENNVKLLGVQIDSQLKFDNYVQNICSKAGRKLSALTKMVPYLSFNKKRILLKSFFNLNLITAH